MESHPHLSAIGTEDADLDARTLRRALCVLAALRARSYRAMTARVRNDLGSCGMTTRVQRVWFALWNVKGGCGVVNQHSSSRAVDALQRQMGKKAKAERKKYDRLTLV